MINTEEKMKVINVAVDGPAGSGKSSVSKRVALDLGYIYVDTGAMYRAVALKLLNENVKENDEEKIKEVLTKTDIDIKYIDSVQHVFSDKKDVTDKIRTNEVSKAASDFSKIKAVREKLFNLQKELAKKNNCIMDGRDIGTNILPNADVKIFLTASAEKRAERRYLELKEKGECVDIKTLEKEILIRDKNDTEREISPLKKADDAVLLDTSDLSFDEVCETVKRIIMEQIS